jgi:hypothetical protein
MMYGALAIPVVGVAAGGAGNPNVGRMVLLATPIVAGTGYYIRTRAVNPDAWTQAAQSFSVGRTHASEVRECLGKPQSIMQDGSEETLVYAASHPAMFFGSGNASTVSFVFRNGVLSNIRKSATDYR